MKYKNILLTGAHGFVGRNLYKKLVDLGYKVHGPHRSECDLVNYDETLRTVDRCHPDAIIHCAALCGGIGANIARPYDFCLENAVMGQNLIQAAIKYGKIKKFVSLGTICMYPATPPIPFQEKDLWDGFPEISNSAYSISKKYVLILGNAARQQHGLNFITLMPTNIYGVGDTFNTTTSHVIPAMIVKFINAKKNNDPFVQCWGSGKATRSFANVNDVSRGIIQAMEYYDGSDPVNLAGANVWGANDDAGSEISMKGLATIIKDLVGYNGDIIWKNDGIDGQPRRVLSGELAKELFGYTPKISLYDGLKDTIDWYNKNYK